MKRSNIGVSCVLLGGLWFAAPTAAAQDVLVQGRANGVAAPQWAIERLRQDPTAFRFTRGWKHKVARIRERRQQVARSLGPSYTTSDMASMGAVVTGTYGVPVIAGLYSDATAPHTQATYQTRLFGDGAGSVSLSEYYSEISRGVFTMTGQVSNWVALPSLTSFYEPDPMDPNDRFGRTGEFIRDAVMGADASVDFSQYDNDGLDGVPNSGDDDGFVDTIALIYPSEAKSCGGVGPGIWPHRWVYSGWGLGTLSTNDASANGGFVQIADYIIQSGLACFGGGIMASGTIAHEMGHALGLPDLYDTNTNDGTDSEGIGEWGLMGSGNHNEQNSPAHMSAWSKDFLGWANVTTVAANQNGVSLQSIQTTGDVLRVDVPMTNEYFLLSNRQATGSDVFLHEPGLLVWHIDPDVIAAKDGPNTVNADPAHKGVDLEEADGVADMDAGNNRGDAGDSFPGTSSVTTFDVNSNPNSLNYSGAPSGLAIRNITNIGGVVGFDIAIDELATFVWGDVNNDAVVDVTDVDIIYRHALGWMGADPALIPAGDVDSDGDVDVADGFLTHSYIGGVSTSAYRVGEVGAGTPPPLSGSPPSNSQRGATSVGSNRR